MFTIYFNHINNKDKSRFLYEEFLDFENFNVTQNKNEIDNNNTKASDNSKNVIVLYDGEQHSIEMNINKETNAILKYMDSKGEYSLSDIPKYSAVGIYTIKYNNTQKTYTNNFQKT